MLERFTGGDFTKLLNERDKFILLVYFDGQQKDNGTASHLTLLPTEHPKFERSQHKVIMDMFSGVTYVETYHHESYDLVNNFGFSYEDLWDDYNEIFRPLIISVKNGWIVSSSYGECYCTETYMDVIHSIYPELFVPPSVSES